MSPIPFRSVVFCCSLYLMTRLWPDGILVQVLDNGEGVPQRLSWAGRRHTVSEITRRWRVQSDWWRETVWRDYFKLTTETGLLLIIYHDLQSEGWYLQRLYD